MTDKHVMIYKKAFVSAVSEFIGLPFINNLVCYKKLRKVADGMKRRIGKSSLEIVDEPYQIFFRNKTTCQQKLFKISGLFILEIFAHTAIHPLVCLHT